MLNFFVVIFCTCCIPIGRCATIPNFSLSSANGCVPPPDCRTPKDVAGNYYGVNTEDSSLVDKSEDRVKRQIFDARHHPNYHLLPNLTDCGISLVPNTADRQKRLVNGKPAGFGKYLMTARILARNSSSDEPAFLKCTGTLINNRYILTTGLCVILDSSDSGITLTHIHLGAYDLNQIVECTPSTFENKTCGFEILREIQEIVVHPDFSSRNAGNNIALIRMDSDVNFTEFVKPVCLPYNQLAFGNLENQTVQVAGWGRNYAYNDPEMVTDKLYEIDMKIVPTAYCDIFGTNRGDRDNKSICALSTSGMDVCTGDFGAPMIKTEMVPNENIAGDGPQFTERQFQVGIASTSPTKSVSTCGRQGVPTIFTSALEFMPWILDNLKE